MRDNYTDIRTLYYTLLQGSITLNGNTVNVYDVVKANESNPYIYFAEFEAVEDSCKDNFTTRVTLGLVVVSKFTNAVGGSADVDNIANQILKLLHNDTYLSNSNFRVVLNKMIANFVTKTPTQTGTQINKTIRLEHVVEQIGGDLTRITDLAAAGSGTTQIDLSWTNVTGNTGYRVERSLDLASWSLLTTLAQDAVTHSDTGLTTNTIYYYRVRAFDASGGSAWSNTAAATTGQTATQVTKDSAATVLYTDVITEGTTNNRTIADGAVSNSDDSYTAAILAEGTLELPDITITEPDASTSTAPAVTNIDVRDYKSGIAYNRPQLTGQLTSYRTGDDAWHLSNGTYDYTPPLYPTSYAQLDTGDAAPFLNLLNNNAFGNKNRFTDDAGGQTYSNNYVIDHLTGLGWYNYDFGDGTWNTHIDTAYNATDLTYSDWRLPNIEELYSILNKGQSNMLEGSPFNNLNSLVIRTSSTRIASTSNAWYASTSTGVVNPIAKTTSFNIRGCQVRNHYT